MIVETSTRYEVILNEAERWDFTDLRRGEWVVINVERISFTRYSERSEAQRVAVFFSGPRRLKRGGLSVQEPLHLMTKADSIPPNIARQLIRGGAL